MKITIIGRGNAGCLSALHFAHYTNEQIELVYDSNTPTEYVGQASVLELPNLLWETLDVDLYNNPFYATIKSGILYENWGKKQEKIFHPFSLGSYGIHYDTRLMQDFILDRLSSRIKIKDKRINSYDEIDSDYIIDCTGFTKEHKGGNLGKEYTELVNPLNSVLLANINEHRFHPWTRAVATPDGWCFVIPLHDTVSLGYMYNSDITSRELAEDNFKELFDVDNIRDNFPFKCFLAKNPIQDERIILNGNRLFFLEPLESTAVQTYLYWNRQVFDWMTTRSKSSMVINEHIKTYTRRTQNFILWHYLNGSKYDTPFWEYAKTLSIDDPEFFRFLHLSRTNDKSSVDYGQWNYKSFRIWEDGISIR
jgi:tryptophan halogenase